MSADRIQAAREKNEEILASLSPDRIYGARIDLRKNGSSFVGLCPFHSEKTASFTVFADLGYKCFGCGRHGSAFDFVMETMGLDFQAARAHLAAVAGVSLDTPKTRNARNPALRVTVEALASNKKLPEEFLRSLGLTDMAGGGVKIPYFLSDGTPAPRQRIRTALSARNGSHWDNKDGSIVPYGLWKLAEARDAGFLDLVEGESDTWTLWYHGFPCLGMPGATTANCLEAGHVADFATIYILREPDRGGTAFVRGVAKRLGEIGWNSDLRVLSLAPFKDPNDLHQCRPEDFKDKFRAAQEGAAPLSSEAMFAGYRSSWPEPPTKEAFYGLAGEFVRTVEPHTEADCAALLIQFLVATGSVIGRGPYFMVEQHRHHVNVFALIVGETSKARKGSSLSQVLAPLSAVDSRWAETRIMGGIGSGEGIIWNVRDPFLKGDELLDEGVGDKRLLLVETEFAQVLAVLERQGATVSEILRRAWDGATLQTLVKNNPTRATNAHVAMIGHITRAELVRRLPETEIANGLANRFIICCARRSKLLPDGGALDWEQLGSFTGRIGRAIEFAKNVGEMKRDGDAQAAWEKVYGPLSDAKPGLVGTLISRGEAQVLRLSMLHAVLDCSEEIRKEHLAAALALWAYSEASCRYIFGDSLGDPTADEILRVLRTAPEGLTRTDIRDHFSRNRSETEITRALNVLLEYRLARILPVDETRGRPPERWVACQSRYDIDD
jgi:hypothetical protein